MAVYVKLDLADAFSSSQAQFLLLPLPGHFNTIRTRIELDSAIRVPLTGKFVFLTCNQCKLPYI